MNVKFVAGGVYSIGEAAYRARPERHDGYTGSLDKAAARASHDLMLKRIEQGLEEDRSNALMWRGKSGRRRLQTMFELSDFHRARLRAREATRRRETSLTSHVCRRGICDPGE